MRQGFLSGQQRDQGEATADAGGNPLENLQTVINAAMAVLVTDSEGKILEANDRFCQVSRYLRTDLLGENYLNRTDARFPESFQEIWPRVLSGSPWEGKVECSAKTGVRYWVHVTIIPLSIQERIERIVFACIDISPYLRDREASAEWLRSSLWLEHVRQDFLAQRSQERAVRALSLREEQVLRLVAQGLANKNIASRLNISIRTVEIHRAHLMRKLGVRTSAALIKYALEHELVEKGGPDAGQA